MKTRKKILFLVWGSLFIVTAALGFIPEARGFGKALLFLLGIGFFVPGGMLLFYAVKEKDIPCIRFVRKVSSLSLCATFLLLVANFCSVFFPDAVGVLLYILLTVVSAPMACCQFWALSLFLWACLLLTSITALKAAKKS